MDKYKDLLYSIVSNLLQGSDTVSIELKEKNNNKYFYDIFVDKSNVGRVIGKKGSIVFALKTIIQSIAHQNNDFVNFTISSR